MASAIFIAPIQDTNPVTPPMSDPGDGSIYLSHAEGHGYACIGEVPNTSTCLIRVWTEQVIIDAMAADPNYLFVEQVD